MKPTSRRGFLESLRRAAGAAVTGLDANHDVSERADISWHKAPCRFCGAGCGVEVGVSEGRAVSVRGDTQSPVNRGLLCVKGHHLPAILYGEDRLQRPQRRRADGTLEDISWERALALVADRYRAALDSHGADSVAMYGSGQWTVFDGYAASKWFKGGMRSNQLEANTRLCTASTVAGFMTQFGSDEPMGCYDDLDIADDFVLWGNNMAEMHPVLFSRMLERKRRDYSTRIVDLATRRTPTTHYADLSIQFRPGTDLALANGILHLLFARGHIDRTFAAENLVFKRGEHALQDTTLDEIQDFLADYSPDRVSRISGVSTGHIETLADIYGAGDRNTVSLWCVGVNQHVRGTWMNNLINDIHLITGKIGRPGSNPLSLSGQPSACGTTREVGTLADRLPADMVVTNPAHRARAEALWHLPAGTIPDKPGRHAVDMWRAWARGDVKVMWVQCTNPMVSMPNLARYQRRPGHDQFLVVSDIYPTQTTEQADLILPSAAWIEREGIFGNAERRGQHWHQMVDPPGQAREDAWQIMAVAERMGMGHLFPWHGREGWHQAMYEEYRRFGAGTGMDLAGYEQLVHGRGARWPVVDGRETRYRYAAGHDPYVGKAEGVHFYKATQYGERAAFITRPYVAPPETPDAAYPLWLTTGRVLEHWHTGTMTRRVPQLRQAVPRAYVEMNPADADELGVRPGDTVRVSSRRGAIELPAVVEYRDGPPRGTIFVPFFDEGSLINRLTLDATDNISGQPDYKKCAVKLERVPAATEPATGPGARVATR